MTVAKTEWAEEALPTAATDPHPALSLTRDHGAIEQGWRDLEGRAVGSPFQRYDFFAAWMDHVGQAEGAEPLVVTASSGGRLAMVLPLVRRRRAGLTVAEFAGGSHANHNTGLFDPALLALPPGVLATRLRALVSDHGGGVDLLRLGAQPGEIGGRPNPLIDDASHPSAHAAYDLSLAGGFDAVLARHKGSKKRKRVRSHARLFAEVGGPRVERATTAAEAVEVLEAFLAQKATRLAAQGLPDVFARPGTAAFLSRLAEASFTGPGAGLADFYALRHDAGLSATGIALPYGGRQFLVMSSFADDAFSRASPGELTLFHMIEDACARGLDAYDFGVGDARYKRSWCDREMTLYETLWPLSPAGAVASGAFGLARAARAFVVARPALHRLAQRLRRGRGPDAEDGGGDDEG
jgi:CelD/BcsL family acetyltransferase involved in cellulose biosynthesis